MHLPWHRTARRTGVRVGAVAFAAAALAAPVALLTPAQAATPPAVKYSASSVALGTRVTATVDPDTVPAGGEVILQRRFPDAWRTADGSASRTSKGLVLTVPTDQYGSFTYRVAVRGAGETPSTTDKAITVRTGYDPLGRTGQHVFMGSPRVRWDSCSRITWKFNAANAPRGALDQLKQGFARIHRATGLEFRYAGKTDRAPLPNGNARSGADIIVGWRTPKQYSTFAKKPGVVGVGGNTYYYGYQEWNGTEVSRAFMGGVVLNARQKGNLRNGFGSGYTWGEVIIHELGHVVGLGHPGASSQIMYYKVTRRNAQWGAGDLTGLRKVGDTRGCLTRAPARAGLPTGRTTYR